MYCSCYYDNFEQRFYDISVKPATRVASIMICWRADMAPMQLNSSLNRSTDTVDSTLSNAAILHKGFGNEAKSN